MSPKLSTFFTLDEMTHSQYASRQGIDNTPNGDAFLALQETAIRMDEVRRILGAPVLVSSGYRCAELNKAIGGSKTSDHMTGHAVDFTCPSYGSVSRVFKRLRISGVKFDQMIIENNAWVHLGFGPRMRGEMLVYEHGQYRSATVIDPDNIAINAINAAGYKAYASSGVIQYNTPVDLTGYLSRMTIKDKVGGTTLASTDDILSIAIDAIAYTITLTISAVNTAAITWLRGIYELEMVSPAGVVTTILSGSVFVTEEVAT